jgi:hypothetical protein
MQNYHPVLQELYKQKDQAYGVFCDIQERTVDFVKYSKQHNIEELKKNQQIEVFALEISRKSSEQKFNETIKLCSMLEKLSENELVELVSATDSEYEQWKNDEEYNLLDYFSLKKEVFKYIINPSENVSKAHATHCQHIENK